MNEATFVQICDQVSDGVVIFTHDGIIKYANRAYQEMTGFDPTDLEHPVFGLTPDLNPEDETLVKIDAAIKAGAPCVGEVLTRKKDGGSFWNSFSIKPHFNDDGSIRHFVCLSRDITAQKNAESKALGLERSYQTIFDNVEAAIVVYGSDGRVRVANRRAVEILGISSEGLQGRPASPAIYRLYQEDGSELPEHEIPVRKAISTKNPITDVFLRYQRISDGKNLWLIASAFPILDHNREVLEVLLSFSDVSRIIESEAEAKALRERFELAVRATQDAVFEWNLETGAFWASEAFRTVYGYDPPSHVSLDNLSIKNVDVLGYDKIFDIISSALESGSERYSLDYEFIRPDGLSGHVAVRAFIARNEQGVAQRVIGTATDIGQLTQANIALEQSEQRFRIIAGSASDVLWDYDFYSGATWSSPDWPAKLGVDFDPRLIENFGWMDMLVPDDRARILATFRDAIKSDATEWGIECKALSPDGQTVDLAIKSSIIRDANGRATRILGNMRNITREKRNQEVYTRSRALEAVGQLTGGVAHDFNNLLMIILGNAELLEAAELPEEHSETISAISQAAESAANLTGRLLTFARQAQLTTTRVDVKALVSDTLGLLRSGLPETITLIEDVPTDLWDVNVDANSLGQAIVNLAMNAHDAMPRGGSMVLKCANLEVGDDTSSAPDDLARGRYVAISAIDDGEGMTPEVIARAFEPFFTTKDIGKGTGLGLSTVYGFAKQSGGGVAIDSKPGQGTTITLYLPAAEADAPQNVQSLADNKPALPSRQKRILLVEDEPQVRSHVERVLVRLGYSVATATDAASALSILERDDAFDLLFTDVIMPGGTNGQELGEAAIKLVPKIKIFYTSGYPADAFEHLPLGSGEPINFLEKPYRAIQLSKKLASILQD